ncbi:hypothetical protein [Micrococcus luteus]|uniref:hypothetical protein n=1 Tax=Micrococcus luteus TaxID=1270 RepID=UPI00333214DE
MDWIKRIRESQKKIDEAHTKCEKIAFNARAADRKARDDMDASLVQSLRELGREIGQEKEYDKRIRKILKERGY